jgi:hypothetical protein
MNHLFAIWLTSNMFCYRAHKLALALKTFPQQHILQVVVALAVTVHAILHVYVMICVLVN